MAEIKRLDTIVEQLLYYARPSDSGRGPVDINQTVTGVLPLVNYRVEKEGIRLATHLEPALPLTVADEEQIKQVLLNMIINSTQAMDRNGRLTISTGLSDGGKDITIIIEDTGRGIHEKDLHKLFNPFFTTRSDGTGLGLAVSHRIIELHHGDIRVCSEPGKGTSFAVSLPVQAPTDQET